MGGAKPRDQVILRAVRNEVRLRKKGKQKAHRFRSWTVQRYRPVYLGYQVVLTTHPSLMDGRYISGCIYKAAALKKHDIELWSGYVQRLRELKDMLTPQDIGLIFYGIGKSLYPYPEILKELLPLAIKRLQDFSSQSLMFLVWGLTKHKLRDHPFLCRLAEEVVRRESQIRPIDFLKIFNCLAIMDLPRSEITKALSTLLMEKSELLTSQHYRFLINPTAVINLHIKPSQKLIMNRGARIRTIMRARHMRATYRTGVALRVLHPSRYESLGESCRRYVTRLSLKQLNWMTRYPTLFHWEVSALLYKLGVPHRNMFLWGCYWIDIGEEDKKNQCWMIDGPSSFYHNSLRYKASVKLEHRVLWNLGWKIRRIPWNDWVQLERVVDKLEYLSRKRMGIPDSEDLMETSLSSNQLQHLQSLLQQKREDYTTRKKRFKETQEIDLRPIYGRTTLKQEELPAVKLSSL